MAQEKRTKCCRAKIVKNKDKVNSCHKCGKIIGIDDVETITTRATVKLVLKAK